MSQNNLSLAKFAELDRLHSGHIGVDASEPPKKTKPDQCHECQLKAGAKEPARGLNGVTCTRGKCPGCGKVTFLIYACDYDWPDGSKAVWD